MLKKSTALNIGFNKLQYLVGTYYVQGTRSKMSQKMPAPERVLLQIRAQWYIITLQKRFHGQFKGGRQDKGSAEAPRRKESGWAHSSVGLRRWVLTLF